MSVFRRSQVVGALTVAALVATGLVPAAPAVAAPPKSIIRGADSPGAIAGSYIVKLKDTASVHAQGIIATAQSLSRGQHGTLGHVWDRALHGFSTTMTADQATKLAADPNVEYVEQNHRFAVAGTQTNPPSPGLDRIDQRALPLDNSYSYDAGGGAGVHAYVVDTGIRITHTDFGGRASYGYDFVDNDAVADDCNGHGTHVAGTVGGTQYGVAKKVRLVAVRAFDCMGRSTTTSLMDSLNWVIGHAVKPAVVNLSIAAFCVTDSGRPGQCPPGSQQTVIDAENALVAAGLTVVASGGNEAQDACNDPTAAVPDVITVGAVNQSDARWISSASFASNFGQCIDIWAPGQDIVSDYKDSDTDTGAMSGTSMAAPHVTGAVALLLGSPSFATATPAQITGQLLSVATVGILTNLGDGSPNRLLYVAPPIPYGGSPVALARSANGRLELFGVNSSGALFHRAQTTAGGTAWSGWSQAATRGWFSVAAEPNVDGRFELASLTTANQIWHRQQATVNADSWFAWSQIAGSLTSVAIARNQNGRLEMAGTNQLGQIFYSVQTASNATTWSLWIQLTFGGKLRSVAADTDAAGRITIVALDQAGAVWHATQAAANSDGWGPFDLYDGLQNLSEVALARNGNGTLEVVGTDGFGGVARRSSAGASGWTAITPKTLRHIAAETNSNGRVHLIGIDNVGNIWQCLQTAANATTYSLWTPVDGNLRA